jgi:hypothetical protein
MTIFHILSLDASVLGIAGNQFNKFLLISFLSARLLPSPQTFVPFANTLAYIKCKLCPPSSLSSFQPFSENWSFSFQNLKF